ncbi:MAG: vWA domain-containing protein [Deinococcus sp.]
MTRPPSPPDQTLSAQNLSASVTAFARLLRGLGLSAGPGETAEALGAMGALNLLDLTVIRDALRMIFTARRSEEGVFDAAFQAHFLNLDGQAAGRPRSPQPDGTVSPEKPAGEAPRDPPADADDTDAAQPAGLSRRAASDSPPDETDAQARRAHSSPDAGEGGPAEALQDESELLLASAARLLRRVRLGRSRRWRALPRGPRFDFRRTLHAALRTAGDPLWPRYQGHPRRSPRFLLVIDGSRSMEPYAGLLLRYAQALGQRSGRVEVYAFSTGLTRLTPQLRLAAGVRPGGTAPLRLDRLGAAWGGGTRIGENLLKLCRDERARPSPDTVVMVLSDGLDTGEPELLARAARELRRLSGLLVWLNPLAGQPGYRPLARGMAAALPSLDLFASADSPAALLRLPDRVRMRR